jgi:RNA polymerase sigma-70 factor (ECF subfamily)
MADKVTDTHIEQIKVGNEEAWKTVKEDFESGLRSRASQLLRNNGFIEKATEDDLVQDTWLKAWNGRASFRGSTVPEFVKWLLVILKNTYVDKCRQRKFELTSPSIVESTLGSVKTPSEIVRLDEHDTYVNGIVATLDSLTRNILKLKHVDGLTFREIADVLGKNPNSVASIYRRALQGLKGRFVLGSSGCIDIG